MVSIQCTSIRTLGAMPFRYGEQQHFITHFLGPATYASNAQKTNTHCDPARCQIGRTAHHIPEKCSALMGKALSNKAVLSMYCDLKRACHCIWGAARANSIFLLLLNFLVRVCNALKHGNFKTRPRCIKKPCVYNRSSAP